MKTVIIVAAPITKEKFDPVIAEFPISDNTLLNCIGSYAATNDVLSAACTMLGLDYKTCVSGMYYRLPERANRPFECFVMDLRRRYNSAREDVRRQQEAMLRERRQNLFQAVMAL